MEPRSTEPDGSFLDRQRERLRDEAGALSDVLEDITEEEFDRRAAEVLARWDTNEAARRALKEGEPTMVEQVFTVDGVAEHMKVKATTVREWLRKGYLRGFKLSEKEWRVRATELQAFIERLAAAQEAAEPAERPKRGRPSAAKPPDLPRL